MCGIAGLWFRDRARTQEGVRWVREMLAALAHRGPDDEGVWTDEWHGVVLGHRRLSVIDLSPAGHQPMVSPGTGSALTYNGELYNFPELRLDLEQAGIPLRGHSDTEVLLAGYDRWGPSVLERSVGMFGLALWDAPREQLVVARDRAGEKPLYYAHTPWGFAFASELGALARLPEIDRRLDDDAVALFLQHRVVPAPHTVYRGVRKLLPAHWMTVALGGEARAEPYWDPVAVARRPRLSLSPGDALERLDGLLRTSIRGQRLADVPLGTFLSGGYDSTVVTSLLQETQAEPVRTFTIRFGESRFNEADHARRVADHLGTDHSEETLTSGDALDLLPSLHRIYGEPFADESALPTHLVSRVARSRVTVCLSGDGGDEVFGGYRSYQYLARIRWLTRGLGKWAAWPLRLLPDTGNWGHLYEMVGRPLPEMFRVLNSTFTPAAVRKLMGHTEPYPAFETGCASSLPLSTRQKAMLTDLLAYLPDDILAKVDRAAMACSLETRAPLLDHRVIEFALRLPSRYVRDRWLFRQYVHRRVPRTLVDRPKMGFAVPVGDWFRGALRETLIEALRPDTLEQVGIVAPAMVQRLLRQHLGGRRDHGKKLWTLFVLCTWARETGI